MPTRRSPMFEKESPNGKYGQRMQVVLGLLVLLASAAAADRPYDLRVALKASPSMGVSARPAFQWVVPHISRCAEAAQRQHGYRLVLAADPQFGAALHDSGNVTSPDARHVSPRELPPGRRLYWRVKTWALGGGCESEWSRPAELVTGLSNGFSNGTVPIWAGAGARYALLQKMVHLVKPVRSAHAFVTAGPSAGQPKLLGSYRLYANGRTYGMGPGRGEVYVADAGGASLKPGPATVQYDTIDMTAAARESDRLLLGLQCYHEDGQADAKALLELHLSYEDGSSQVIGTDSSWRATDATAIYNPQPQSEGPGYDAPQENFDGSAFLRISGWTNASMPDWPKAQIKSEFGYSMQPKKALPLQVTTGVKPLNLSKLAVGHYFFDFGEELMGGIRLELPAPVPAGLTLQITLSEELVGPGQVLYPMRTTNHYRSEWSTGRGASAGVMVLEHHEYMLFRYGELLVTTTPVPPNATDTCKQVAEGLVLNLSCGGVSSGSRISTVKFASYGTPSGYCNKDAGDTFAVNSTCHSTSSKQVLEKACLGRPSCQISASNSAFGGDPCHLTQKSLAVDVQCSESLQQQELGEFSMSAWVVKYPWKEDDSDFVSSNQMLNRVWKLCKDTLRVTSLDTTTDSNTRERLPYEADGAITGASRYVFQNEYMWQRHSSIHQFLNPTWPTEWRQFMPLMAFNDYMMTGDLELFNSYYSLLLNGTQAHCLNKQSDGTKSTPTQGLVDFGPDNDNCPRSCSDKKSDCRDNIDWPMDTRDGYVLNDASTVINAFTVKGLQAMSIMSNASGNTAQAAVLQGQASALAARMNEVLWNNSTGLYVDGVGSPAATKHSAWHAQSNTLWAGIPESTRHESMLEFLQSKRMAGSVYGAYAFLLGLYHITADHGKFALQMMTSCDESSWCHMLQVGATATMEAWSREQKPNLSWSHPWATAPASAIARGFMGLVPTAPKYTRFRFMPQPGDCTSAKLLLPTLSGSITASFVVDPGVSFNATLLAPANTVAEVCLPKGIPAGNPSKWLLVDGSKVTGYFKGDYVCIDGYGSGQREIVRMG